MSTRKTTLSPVILMSQGAFTLLRYKTSEVPARVLIIKAQPETTSDDNTEATGTLSPNGGRVRAPGRSRKAYGIHARYVTLSRKVGAPDGPYTGGSVTVKIPILDPANVSKYPAGGVTTYRTIADWVVVGVTPELIR